MNMLVKITDGSYSEIYLYNCTHNWVMRHTNTLKIPNNKVKCVENAIIKYLPK